IEGARGERYERSRNRARNTGEIMTARKSMIVYGAPLSVHTRKVILAARCKSIPYEVTPVIPVIPDNPPPNWRSLSPGGTIPAIHKKPGDPAVIETALGTAAPQAFAYLESLAPEGSANAFLVDGRLSVADLAVTSNLVMFHYLGNRLDAARFPRVAAYFRRQL